MMKLVAKRVIIEITEGNIERVERMYEVRSTDTIQSVLEACYGRPNENSWQFESWIELRLVKEAKVNPA